MPPILCIVGKSDTGKTTLIERLIPPLVQRGLRIGTIKHDVHGFEIDHPGKDTWRHRQAGSRAVAIVSPERLAVIREEAGEATVENIAAQYFDGIDLVLAEGFKSRPLPKIEVARRERGSELLARKADGLLAVVSDQPHEIDVPVFPWDDLDDLVELIARWLSGQVAAAGPPADLANGGHPVRLNDFVRQALASLARGLTRVLHDVPEGAALEITVAPGERIEAGLRVDDQAVVCKPFIQNMLGASLRGFVSTLDNVDPETELVVRVPGDPSRSRPVA